MAITSRLIAAMSVGQSASLVKLASIQEVLHALGLHSDRQAMVFINLHMLYCFDEAYKLSYGNHI